MRHLRGWIGGLVACSALGCGIVLGLTLHNAFGEQPDYVPVTEFSVP